MFEIERPERNPILMEEAFDCCGIVQIGCFPGSNGTVGENYNMGKRQLRPYLDNRIKQAKREGYVIITAYTRRGQRVANELLKEFGFKKSNWVKPVRSNSKGICVWYKELGEKNEV